MYFWYTVAVFLAVVEILILALAIDCVIFAASGVKKIYRNYGKYLWTTLLIVLFAVAIQICKDHDFYRYLNDEQTEGLLFVALKYSMNILLGFLEFVLGYIFYRKVVEKICKLRSRKSEERDGD